MDQHGAHILATLRGTEFAAEATAARQAAALREQAGGEQSPTTDHPISWHRAATT